MEILIIEISRPKKSLPLLTAQVSTNKKPVENVWCNYKSLSKRQKVSCLKIKRENFWRLFSQSHYFDELLT